MKGKVVGLLVALLVLLGFGLGTAQAQDGTPVEPSLGEQDGLSLPADAAPNNTPDTAFPIDCGETWFKHVTSAGEVDWWQFEGRETQEMVVWVRAAEEGFAVDSTLKLYEGAPDRLVEENSDYDGKDSRLHYLTGDDVYYLRFEDLNDSQLGVYRISLDIPMYISMDRAGSVGGVTYDAGDILVYYRCRQQWAMFLDMSNAGLTANTSNFATLDGGARFVMGFNQNANVPGVGAVVPQDLVVFNAVDIGPDTTGTFQYLFDGSDVGLTTTAEAIDAVTVSRGNLLLSLWGTGKVATVGKFQDEDVVRFRGQRWGATTAGSWELWLDGTAAGLSVADLRGLWYNDWYYPGEDWWYLTFDVALGGGAIQPNDVAYCFTEDAVSCPMSLGLDGATFGLKGKIDAFDGGPHPHDTLNNLP